MSKTNGAWRNRIVGYGEEPPDQLLANPLNFRIHPKAQQEATTGSLDTLGWIDDVIVNRTTGHVVDGHLRITLALRAGAPTVPVKYVELTEAEEEQALLSLDPIAAMAATDKAKLDELIRGVQTDNKQVMEYIAELAEREGIQYGAPPPDDPGAQIDKAEELREKWGVELGQLWQLGEHRLICGDCTDRAVVERVMDGEKADLCLTDPPYGVNLEYDTFIDTKDNLKKLIDGWFPLAQEYCSIVAFTPGNPNYWLYPPATWVLGWFYGSGLFRCPWGFLGWQPILVYGKDPYLAHGLGARPDSINLTATDGGTKDSGHPCPKPSKFWDWLLERCSIKKWEIVYEPFCGSGITITTCERLKRKCRAVEISPAYCAVAIQRWVDMTGGEPVLLG